MNGKQKRRLINILKLDCGCAGDNKVGNITCAIGAMVVATASPNSKVYRDMLHDSTGISGRPLLVDHLSAKFGLGEDELQEIQYFNDLVENEEQWPNKPNSPANVRERRQKVLKYVRSLKVTK